MDKHFVLIASITLAGTTLSAQQTGEWYMSGSMGGLCNKSVVLFKDGTYNYEAGCEASSHFSFGTWIQKKDTIIFHTADNKKFNVIRSIVATKNNSKNITVRILDNKGNNITEKITAVHYVKGKGIYKMDLDTAKTAWTDYKRENGIIILKSLQLLFRQKLTVTTDSSNDYEITLNLPGEWIFSSNSDWSDKGDFKLLKTKDALISLEPNDVDENWKLKKTVYTLQKN